MPAIFPKWTNQLPFLIAAGLVLVGGAVTAGVTYYFTPKYSRVGYEPIQPVPFSHAVHAGQLGVDCRYCHTTVDKSWFSNIPSASTCMNCHNQVLKDDPRLALVRESATNNVPIPWVQIHRMPDYAYFNHSVHVRRGISCVECHGRVDEMDEVRHAKSLTMAFCLNCHRDPAAFIRPENKVTDLGWQWSTNAGVAAEMQTTNGARFVDDWHVQSLDNCSACHR
jgi:formate-dependent nitrite reductase cytochrome c552 subunit